MKLKHIINTLTILLLLSSANATAQTSPLSSKSKKAVSMFTEAINYYNQKDFPKAMRILDKATQEDPAFVEAFILKGDILSEEQYPREAIVQYKKGIAANPDFSPVLYFIVANVELLTIK